jgi:hypothetical protein
MAMADAPIIIAGHMFLPRNDTERAYLLDAARYWRWYARRYEAATIQDAFATDALTRYRRWCTARLSPHTIARRRAALAWFVEVAARAVLACLDSA